MSTPYISAGSTLHISATLPATYDSTGYAALTWTAVGEITDIGEFGREYNILKHQPLANRYPTKKKGTWDEGSLSVKLRLDTDDAGQILLKAAGLADTAYSIKVTTVQGDKYYMAALVNGVKVGVGGADGFTEASANMEITSSTAGVGVVEVLAP